MGLFGGSSGSGAAEMAAKYAALVEFLEGKMNELENDIGNAENALTSVHDTFQSNEDSAEGYIMDTFVFKENTEFCKVYTTIIQNMRAGAADLKYKKAFAEYMKIFWEQKAELEERSANAGL